MGHPNWRPGLANPICNPQVSSNTDADLYGRELVRAVINVKWESYARAFLLMQARGWGGLRGTWAPAARQGGGGAGREGWMDGQQRAPGGGRRQSGHPVRCAHHLTFSQHVCPPVHPVCPVPHLCHALPDLPGVRNLLQRLKLDHRTGAAAVGYTSAARAQSGGIGAPAGGQLRMCACADQAPRAARPTLSLSIVDAAAASRTGRGCAGVPLGHHDVRPGERRGPKQCGRRGLAASRASIAAPMRPYGVAQAPPQPLWCRSAGCLT